MNKYESLFGLGVVTALVLDACAPARTSATELPGTGDGGGQAAEIATATTDSVLGAEKFIGADVKVELLTDSEKLVAKAQDFAKGTLITQALETNASGEPTGIKEESIDKPGRYEKYKILSVFEIKAEDGAVKDEFYRVRSMDGAQFLAIKLENIEDGKSEYVRLQEGLDISVADQSDRFAPMLYFDGKDDGSIEYFYPLAFGKDGNGFTGQVIYGEDLDVYSMATLGNAFTAKNAMLTQHLETTMELIDRQMKSQGINEYNYGIDVTGKGWIVYDSMGREMTKDPIANEWVVATGQLWIEQMGEVAPLNLEMTTEFTKEYEKMPKITWEDVSNGRLRETLLEKWESEGRLLLDYINDNGIYRIKPSDWQENPYYFFGEVVGSFLSVNDAENLPDSSPFDFSGRPFRPSPEVFELIEDNGERVGMATTSMVVFERPDGTIGIEPWFYFVGKDSIGLGNEAIFEECLGNGLPNGKVYGKGYPNPTIILDEISPQYGEEIFTPFRTWKEWNETGQLKAQETMLRNVIKEGYPGPELGRELLTATCVLYQKGE